MTPSAKKRGKRKVKSTIRTTKIDDGLYMAIERETSINAYGPTRCSAKRILRRDLEP